MTMARNDSCTASKTGIPYVLRAGDTMEVVAENNLGAPILASPAVARGRIILRTRDEIVVIGRDAVTR